MKSKEKEGIINNMFGPQKTLNKTRTKLYNTLALPASLYTSENGQLNQETQEEQQQRWNIFKNQ